MPGRLLSGTRLWSGGEKPAGFSRVLRRELSGEGRQNKVGILSLGAVSLSHPPLAETVSLSCPRAPAPPEPSKRKSSRAVFRGARRVQGVRFFESVRLLGAGK